MIAKSAQDAKRFAAVADRYLKWVDDWADRPEENARAALGLLPELYLAALALPNIWPDTPYDKRVSKEHHERWKTLTTKFDSLPVRNYLNVFSPLERGDDEPVSCWLADDLADIYLDLEEGLGYLEKGDAEQAIWVWRFGFWNHWGRHLVGALSALHAFQSSY